jgi:adenosylcobinamide-GDP ribazoletransferase
MRAADLGRGGLAATAFLTRIPAGRLAAFDGGDVARAAPLFPLVGGLVGAASGATADLLHGPLSPLLGAALATALGAALTGAMHLDGVADTADALGARDREHALRIMRDHAVGSFGATALVLARALRIGALADLSAAGSALTAAAAAAACARWVPLPLLAALPYARPGGGQGSALSERTTWLPALLGLSTAAGVAVVAIGWKAVPMLALALLAALLAGLTYRRWLGGVTGDVLGAASELSETAALLLAVALL